MKQTQEVNVATLITRIRTVMCKTEAQTSLIWTSSAPNANKKYTLLSSCFPGETEGDFSQFLRERERENVNIHITLEYSVILPK